MKAISLWQPWASMLVLGLKSIETRSWNLPHTGRLAIHAAKFWSSEIVRTCRREPFAQALATMGVANLDQLHLGCLVGTVDIECSVAIPPKPRYLMGRLLPPPFPERAFGDYRAGRFAWYARDPRPLLKPIVFHGRQKLFDVPDSLMNLASYGRPRQTRATGTIQYGPPAMLQAASGTPAPSASAAPIWVDPREPEGIFEHDQIHPPDEEYHDG